MVKPGAVLPGEPSFGSAGSALYASVVEEFELAEHERRQLVEACRCADDLEALAAVVAADGHMKDGRVHPALVESRQLRLALARLLASLRVPDENEQRPQRRGAVRKPYNRGGGRRATT